MALKLADGLRATRNRYKPERTMEALDFPRYFKRIVIAMWLGNELVTNRVDLTPPSARGGKGGCPKQDSERHRQVIRPDRCTP